MFLKNVKLCATLLILGSFVLVMSSAHAGDEKTDSHWPCDTYFLTTRTLRTEISARLDVPETRWASWSGVSDQKNLLATIDAGNMLRVFKPDESARALYTVHWSALGASDQVDARAAWVNHEGMPAIQVGDERGLQRVLFEPFAHPDPSTNPWDASQAEQLESFSLQDGRWVSAFAQADLHRIRIVPVGRMANGYDLPLAADEVLWLSAHKSNSGIPLLAVTTKSELRVYRVEESAAEVIFHTSLASAPVRPIWLMDTEGQSLLVVGTEEGRVKIFAPETHAPPVESETSISSLDNLQAVSDSYGAVILAASRKNRTASLLLVRGGKITRSVEIGHEFGRREEVTLVSGPNGIPVFVSARQLGEKRVIAFSEVLPNGALLSAQPFDHAGESLRGVHAIHTANRRVQVAVRTDRRVYIVDLSN